jgi:hypothetical protein
MEPDRLGRLTIDQFPPPGAQESAAAGEVRRPHISPVSEAPSPPSTAGASLMWRPDGFKMPGWSCA